MKSLSEALHRVPWWALLAGGLVFFIALVVMVVPIHLIGLEHAAATPDEKRAIKNEIRSTFSEGAIDMARGIVLEMRSREGDTARREELDRALAEIEKARARVNEAGAAKQEAGAAKEQAAEAARRAAQEALDEASRAMADAKREAAQALKDLHEPDVPTPVTPSAAPPSATPPSAAPPSAAPPSAAPSSAAPPSVVEPPATPAPPVAPATPPSHAQPSAKKGAGEGDITVSVNPFGPDAVHIEMGDALAPAPPLPPELRQEIRRNIRSDLYRMGVGGALILIFIPLFILTVVAKFFIDRSRAAQRMAESERREAEYQRMTRQVTEAKLSALQAQVEPHFLYNTLASVQALTEVDPQRANAMTGHLIQYLRNALPKMRESLSTVGQEVELVRAYLNILQMRMGERLAFEISVAPGLESAPFPPLMLPSLVENAIKHGLEPQREGGKVTIAAEALDGTLRITVADTGRGLSEAPGQGVGLSNLRERLAALYGDAGRLVIEANEPHGVRATIEVPRGASGMNAGANAGVKSPSAPAASPTSVPPPPPQGAAARTISAARSAERKWRKGLSFAFVFLVAIAAVCAGLAIVGILTGELHVRVGEGYITGAPGALIGAVGVTLGFVVVVLALAIVVAVVYGLGFLFAGLAIFVPIMILVAIFPVLAPIVVLGLVAWWLVRRYGTGAKPSSAPPSAPPPPPAP